MVTVAKTCTLTSGGDKIVCKLFSKEQLRQMGNLSQGGYIKDGRIITTHISAYNTHGYFIAIEPIGDHIIVRKMRNRYGECEPYEWHSNDGRVEDLMKKQQLTKEEVVELVTLFRKSTLS